MPDRPTLPRRTLLKAAGAALAGLGLPVYRAAHATSGVAAVRPLTLSMRVAVDVEYEIRIRGPKDRRPSLADIAAVGHVNSERFLNFKPGTVMFSGIRREYDTDGTKFALYRFVVHQDGWDGTGIVPPPFASADLNRLFPHGVPTEYLMIVRADSYLVGEDGRRTYIGSRETDYAVSDYAMMQISAKDYCA